MHLTPQQVFENFKEQKLDKVSTIRSLIVFIEESEKDEERLESLGFLKDVGVESIEFFKLLENIIISDSNSELRALSIQLISDIFRDKAIKPLKWALQHERDYDCLVSIIQNLKRIDEENSRDLFIEEIKKIKKRQYIDDDGDYPIKSFNKSIKTCIKRKRSKKIPVEGLAEILINFYTIKGLIEDFYTIYFDWDEGGVISSLDFSELGWNVNIWKQKYVERITILSDVKGIVNLKNLKRLDLSNNKLSDIKVITELSELTDLFLCNNRLEEEDSINHLKQLPNLKYLDVTGNKIAKIIKKHDFPNTHVVRYHGINPRLEAFKIFYEREY